MDTRTALKAGLVQAVSIAVIAAVLALALPKGFFVDWGWVTGPAAWALCAVLTAAVVRLPVVLVLAGAALSGVPAVLAVVTGIHWLGTALALIVLALWCGWLAAKRRARIASGASAASASRA
jgi:hypothetical protein